MLLIASFLSSGRQPGTLLILVMALAAACSTARATPPRVQQLRIANTGDVDITGLKVLFPGASAEAEATRVEFGDISAGKTTEYRTVPGGVYRYAAYEYNLDGHPVQQAVVDWIGETPMEGGRFTYQIKLDPEKPPGGQLQLMEVLVDSP